MIDSDLLYTVLLLILFTVYGGSNLYIIVYLRKNDSYQLTLVDFICLYLGNISNYWNLNKRFVNITILQNKHIYRNKLISASHICSPILIVMTIILWMFSYKTNSEIHR
jgi:hypothetical protein